MAPSCVDRLNPPPGPRCALHDVDVSLIVVLVQTRLLPGLELGDVQLDRLERKIDVECGVSAVRV